MTAFELVRDRVESVTGYVGHHRGVRVSTRCPAHEDRQASLSLAAANDRVLVHCFAGCRLDEILAALDLRARDLFDRTDQRWRRPWMPPRPTAPTDPSWTYVTEPPDTPDANKRAIYAAGTSEVEVGHRGGGPVPPW